MQIVCASIFRNAQRLSRESECCCCARTDYLAVRSPVARLVTKQRKTCNNFNKKSKKLWKKSKKEIRKKLQIILASGLQLQGLSPTKQSKACIHLPSFTANLQTHCTLHKYKLITCCHFKGGLLATYSWLLPSLHHFMRVLCNMAFS